MERRGHDIDGDYRGYVLEIIGAGEGRRPSPSRGVPPGQLPVFQQDKVSGTEELVRDMWFTMLQQLPREPLWEANVAKVMGPLASSILADGDDYRDAFVPSVVSIGPIFCGEERLLGMEVQKWLALLFMLRSTTHPLASLFTIVSEMWALEQDVRRECPEDMVIIPSELVRMMVLDGCFILHLLRSKLFKNLQMKSPGDRRALLILAKDLLLVDNQIPFFILEKLWLLCGGGEDPHFVKRSAMKLHRLYDFPEQTICRREVGEDDCEPKHLLHLMLLSYMNKAPGGDSSSVNRRDRVGHRQTRRLVFSATELRAAGIKFRANEAASSILDVSFNRVTGELRIPQLIITRSTASLLRNLLALEQRLPGGDPEVSVVVTDYALFMDSIIDTAADIRLLARCGIVRNCMASDSAAAKFFNTMNEGMAVARSSYYTGILQDIEGYCRSPFPGWWVKLHDDYFGSPWTSISVVVAIMALFLTTVQTYFSAFSGRS